MEEGRKAFGVFNMRGCSCDTKNCNDIVYRFGNTPDLTSKPEVTINFQYIAYYVLWFTTHFEMAQIKHAKQARTAQQTRFAEP